MAIFVVFRALDPSKMEAAIRTHFPKDHRKITDHEWLISTTGTAKDVSDTLGVTTGATGPAIIFSMGNYFGRAPTDIWDWIKAKAEATSG